jgi:hypothetical protein
LDAIERVALAGEELVLGGKTRRRGEGAVGQVWATGAIYKGILRLDIQRGCYYLTNSFVPFYNVFMGQIGYGKSWI